MITDIQITIIFPEKWYFITVDMFIVFFVLFHSCHSLYECDRNFWLLITIGSNLCYHTPPCFPQCNGALSPLLWFIVSVVVFIIVTFWMSVTTCFDRRFHRKYFAVTESSVIFQRNGDLTQFFKSSLSLINKTEQTFVKW